MLSSVAQRQWPGHYQFASRRAVVATTQQLSIGVSTIPDPAKCSEGIENHKLDPFCILQRKIRRRLTESVGYPIGHFAPYLLRCCEVTRAFTGTIVRHFISTTVLLFDYTGGFDGVTHDNDVPTSRRSRCPDVPKVPMSRCPDVPMSRCPDVPMSRCSRCPWMVSAHWRPLFRPNRSSSVESCETAVPRQSAPWQSPGTASLFIFNLFAKPYIAVTVHASSLFRGPLENDFPGAFARISLNRERAVSASNAATTIQRA
ncbi:Uncharacterised protein [Burkholderia pseudomallei]|nr:Uncharacterised protein [Burkholderia pseudomallei]